MINAVEILAQLDKCSNQYVFPMLDNGYIYPAGTRLHAYRDENRWALVIEVIGFNYRGGGHNGITNCLHIFGNCLSYEPGTQNENFLYPTAEVEGSDTFDEEEYFYLNPDCDNFILRNKIFPLPHDRSLYHSAQIELEDDFKISAPEFLRLLDALYHEELIATDSEIRDRIPHDIPKIIELRDWFHPDLVNGELPGGNETFIQIAKVLETGNVNFYSPSRKPNTHWTNWPEGGTL